MANLVARRSLRALDQRRRGAMVRELAGQALERRHAGRLEVVHLVEVGHERAAFGPRRRAEALGAAPGDRAALVRLGQIDLGLRAHRLALHRHHVAVELVEALVEVLLGQQLVAALDLAHLARVAQRDVAVERGQEHRLDGRVDGAEQRRDLGPGGDRRHLGAGLDHQVRRRRHAPGPGGNSELGEVALASALVHALAVFGSLQLAPKLATACEFNTFH
ncbi:hypothetical protein OV079_21090 [Nannocystis pusilla]|uniref:Uncharacterized protein n=1 Tax=Nannocystis pusilla TaxID=889268 RepID=A0A9X3IYG2_9BACT|nr:hypothetical protein [Nannocystis pusilla]MCY1008005.1 hypothetical protein [Nannocystis pusilla]